MKTFGFCKLITYGYSSNNRVYLNELDKHGDRLTVGIYTLIPTEISEEDFYRTEDIPINYDTNSFQIRPKAVFIDNKGNYYIKLDGKKEFLSEINVISMKAIFGIE